MIDHAPADFLREAIIQSPGYVTNLLTSAGMGVTPYLQYIKDYALLGDHFYHSMVNKLMDLGYKNDGWNIDIDEHHIYGSSRVGIHQTKKTLRRRVESYPIEVTLEAVNDIQFMRGKRNYELSNHLGNVQVVISDKRIARCDTELEIERFEADVLSAVDYYPFGMVMPGRQYYVSSDSSMYRFGFNGKESDNEAKGIGNQYDYGFRIYDSRLSRFLSVDPLISSYPWYTPYQFAGNMPIWATDLDGLEEAFATDHYDEETGVYYRKLVFNQNPTPAEIGQIQFKYDYPGGKQTEVKQATGKELEELERSRAAIAERKKQITEGKTPGQLIARTYSIDPPGLNSAPTETATKPVIKKANPKPEPHPGPPATPAIQTPSTPPAETVTNISLDVKFVADQAKFESNQQIQDVLMPIYFKLKANPNNKVILSPTTGYGENSRVSDEFNTGKDLLSARAELIKSWFLNDKKILPSQVIIVITPYNYNKTQWHVTGTMKEVVPVPK